MAQHPEARCLDTGDTFPQVSIEMLDGDTITTPDDVSGHWSVVLFNRGHW